MIGHGQLWWADLAGDKVRPVLILTRANIAPLLHNVLIAPITTTIREIPTEVTLDIDNGVRQRCVANLDNTQLVPVKRLLAQIGEIEEHRWPDVCAAMAAVLSC